MPAFRSMDAMAAAYPVMSQGPRDNPYHKAFCFWCHELMGHEYTCWAAIQQFKAAPNKRMAVFIGQTWLKPSSASVGVSTDHSILDCINPGSAAGALTQDALGAVRGKVTDIASVKSWTGKLKHWGERGALGSVDAQTFADIELGLAENFFDVLRKTPIVTETDIQGSPYYAVSLRNDVPKLASVPFGTDAMGLW